MSDKKIIVDSELEGVTGGGGTDKQAVVPVGKRRFDYTVVQDDNLWNISRDWGCTVQDIVDWNWPLITNPDYIQVGWVLKLYR